MRPTRRRVLAAAGSLAAGLAGCLGSAGSEASTDTASGNQPGSGDALAVVETLAAPGSTAGRQAIPVPETVTVLDLFATWCGPCRAQMESLAAVHDEYGGRVAFVSVTNERFGGGLTAADVREWWRENGGAWTVGHDPESDLMRAVSASGLPFGVVFDADGGTVARHRGVASADRLRADIESAL
jgi:thiol-disulfide isomerase/thioredoxin